MPTDEELDAMAVAAYRAAYAALNEEARRDILQLAIAAKQAQATCDIAEWFNGQPHSFI